jgi:hypothetical protein
MNVLFAAGSWATKVRSARRIGEYCKVAGVVAEVLNEPETKRKKAAKAALVKRLKHIEAVETH